MAKLQRVTGATSVIMQVFIQDNTSTTGAGLTGLVFNTATITGYFHRDTDTTATAISLVTMTVGTFTSGGFKEIDATNMPGWYQFCPPNTAFASGAKSVAFHLKGGGNMAPLPLEVELTATDNQDGVHGGLTALPNAAAAASGGLPILGANATAISFTGGMTISSASGDALALSSSGSNGNGLNASGNGSGAGVKATGGATGNGVTGIGGATSGNGLDLSCTSGDAMKAVGGTNGQGMNVQGAGTGSAIFCQSGSGATGNAVNMVAQSTNGIGLNITGKGSNPGLKTVGGATGAGFETDGGVTSGSGMKVVGVAGNAIGLELQGQGSAAGLNTSGGATGAGAKIVGGATSGDGLDITTTSGDGLAILPTAGNAIVATANGTSKHGAVITGGTGGTSDGLKAVAGTGGVPIRGDLTGNITGNLSGTVGSVTGAVGSVTGAVGSVTGAVGSVTGNVGGNVVGSVASVAAGVTVTTNNDKTGYALTAGERTSVADALLDRDMSVGADSGSTTVRTPRQALRFSRNKWSNAAGTLTVCKEDDSTTSWTASVTQTAGNPVSAIDPAGP